MLKIIYLSPLGYLISFIQNLISIIHQPFMVYGFYNRVTNQFMKNTRVSSSIKIVKKSRLDLKDSVWIGHYSVLDASNCLMIGKGVQMGSHISIYTHTSHVSIRLMGEFYMSSNNRVGYVNGAVSIGEYTFIGDSVIIFPGVNIGKGCLIKAGSILNQSVPDFSIVSGVPAKVVGHIIDIDIKFFDNEAVKKTYFDKNLFEKYRKGRADE